jgi:HK97 family phage prohead protease
MRQQKSASGLRFAGYASVFDQIDRGGDIVRPGAFKRTLGEGKTVPLLWQHQPGKCIGVIEHIAEDTRGLQVIGRLNDDALAAMLGRELQRGRLTGLSFGYRVQAAAKGRTARELNDVDLLEVSLVRRPMQPLARIHKIAA